MDKTVKYLGGIGYILLLVGTLLSFGSSAAGVLAVVGVILAAVAWILLGKNLGDKVMLANGIMMIVGPIITFVAMFGILMSMILTPMFPTTNSPMAPKNPAVVIQTLMSVIAIALIVGIVCWVLQVLSHLRAGNALGISMFKYSAYCQIISFILIVLAFIWMFGNIAAIVPLLQTQAMQPNPELLLKIFGPAFGLIAIGGLLSIVSNILSAVAFFSIEESPEFVGGL